MGINKIIIIINALIQEELKRKVADVRPVLYAPELGHKPETGTARSGEKSSESVRIFDI